MCFVIFLIEALPLFSKIMKLLLSWCRQLSLTLYSCAATKYRFQQMAGMKLSTPAISVSVEHFMLIFYFVELTIGNPRPKDNPPLECPHILVLTANNASTHHFKISLSLELRVRESLLVTLRYYIRCTDFSQSYLLDACTIFVRYAMYVQV